MTKTKEYKTRRNRLQMSLFSMLYHKSGGFLMTPSYVFSNIENTEWGKLKNFSKAIKIITDEYMKEVNETMDSIETRDLIGLERGMEDSFPADVRFGTEEARGNKKMYEEYDKFVCKVMKKLKIKPNYDFKYFEKP